MEQILLAYGKNTKVKVRLPNGHTDYFDIVVDELKGDTLASYLFIISLDYLLGTSIDLMLVKERSRRYSAQTIMDADYADDIALLANTPAQAKSLLHSLERAAGAINIHVNAKKIH